VLGSACCFSQPHIACAVQQPPLPTPGHRHNRCSAHCKQATAGCVSSSSSPACVQHAPHLPHVQLHSHVGACHAVPLTSEGLPNALVAHAYAKEGEVGAQLPHHLQRDARVHRPACAAGRRQRQYVRDGGAVGCRLCWKVCSMWPCLMLPVLRCWESTVATAAAWFAAAAAAAAAAA
jgi:hypothetical protein